MNLSELIENSRARNGGSMRAMAQQATDAGHPISHVQLGDYHKGRVRSFPSLETRRAIAAACDVSVEAVNAAAMETAAPQLREAFPHGFGRATAFLHLTEGRSDAEVEQLLGVVRAALQGFDLVRSSAAENSADRATQN